jgi:hypothetical protein
MVLGVRPLFVVKNLGASRAILGAVEGSAEQNLLVMSSEWFRVYILDIGTTSTERANQVSERYLQYLQDNFPMPMPYGQK